MLTSHDTFSGCEELAYDLQRSMLEEGAAFYDFLARKMPALLDEWHAHRDRHEGGR
ncbi:MULTISPECIES: hypothetical protein [Amycolatopsis]|uniref:Uncharacterized protein n=1 Tax=Amycolatopsis bullii TaxID=941987 RepID=A0ABQ3K450_9PSEU|nr:hypothetical protein [Amycolatopsis bullii]GHG03062.1 hypothetical protein GCM10017567_18120 [Amycolatopsis bullii]